MPKNKRREKPPAEPRPNPSATATALRKRRNRRLIVLGAIALCFPILELLAYRFRAITVTIANRSAEPVTALKFSYPGGDFTLPEIPPADSITRVIRPDYTFRRDDFSTYRATIEFLTPNARHREQRKVGSLDYSAHETYTIQAGPEGARVEIKQTTSPGFPLSAIRELLARLGIG